jgi:hypothetical protein
MQNFVQTDIHVALVSAYSGLNYNNKHVHTKLQPLILLNKTKHTFG